MKRFNRSSTGVTLLEIMLVLAVAAMVIVMSIRYYRNANNSQNANQMLSQINAIMAAAEQVAQGQSGGASFSTVALSGGTTGNIYNITGFGTTPFGTNYTVAGTSATTYTITWGAVPQQVCSQVTSAITSNSKVTVTSACSSGVATLLYTATA